MPKRKLDTTTTAPASPAKRAGGQTGILKAAGTPSGGKTVAFSPPEQLGELVARLCQAGGRADELLGMVEGLQGPSLAMLLQQLEHSVGELGRSSGTQQVEEFVKVLMKVGWQGQGSAVAEAFISFLTNMVSAATSFLPQAVAILFSNFRGGRSDDSAVFRVAHTGLQELLVVAPASAREEMLRQAAARFPFYKMPHYRQLCWVSNLLEMSDYIPNSRHQLISLLLEKLLKLDAHLSRSAIEDSNRAAAVGEKETVNPLVAALDVYMKAMFTYIEEGLHTEGQFDGKKGEELVSVLLEIFTSHVLSTYNTAHSQFLFLYTASLHPDITKRFLQQNWKTFSSVNSPSIVRQTAVAYLSSFLARSTSVSAGLALAWLSRLTSWMAAYQRERETAGNSLDFMHTDLAKHGPYYACCQAVLYLFAFRHAELCDTETKLETLRGLALDWQRAITSPLNPLRVCLPTVVSTFSRVAASYQLVYCNSIIQRNSRLTLPVVGNQSGGCQARPHLLDAFFPFDPYLLPQSRGWVEPHYRQYTGRPVLEDSEDESEEEEDEDEQGLDTPDSGLGIRRTRHRGDSVRSEGSSCGRARLDSVGQLSEILQADLPEPLVVGFS